MNVLSDLIDNGVREQYAEFLRKKSSQQRKESEVIGDMDVVNLFGFSLRIMSLLVRIRFETLSIQ